MRPTRRQIVHGGAVLAGGLAWPLPGTTTATDSGDITGQVARYMVAARTAPLSPEVVEAAKHRILDTLGAIVSGTRLRPGKMALSYVAALGGTAEAGVVGSALRTTAINAAFANAMAAHADETDDFEAVTKAHPGCSAVPAALAMAERQGGSGMLLIRAVALGYDLGCRLLMALGPDRVRASHRSAEGTSSTFCALGGAAPFAALDETQVRYALSYAAQQVSGLWSWVGDEDHIEKAFDFAGMGARNGVMAVTMAQAGMTGVHDVLDGPHNLLIALSTQPDPAAMVDRLGRRFFVTESAIKTYSVGYPNQSALDALLMLRRENTLTPDKVKSIVVRLPTDAVGITGDSAMADVSTPHLIALAMVRGGVSFADSHDAALLQDPAIAAMRRRVRVVADPSLMDPAAPRGAIVEITLADGRALSHHTRFPPGTPQNPLTTDQVNAKVRDLIGPVLGPDKTERLVAMVNGLDRLEDARALTPLLAIDPGAA
jgi:2-methylcitrate dehydratase PrpD